MEKYYRCNKCGQMIAKESFKPSMCTSSALMPYRIICGGAFSIEISKEEVIKQFKIWGYTKDSIDEFFNVC